MTNFTGRWSGFQQYQRALTFKTALIEFNMWNNYEEYLNNHCSFEDSSMVTAKIFNVNHTIRKVFQAHVHLSAIFFECLKLAVPTDDHSPWLAH